MIYAISALGIAYGDKRGLKLQENQNVCELGYSLRRVVFFSICHIELEAVVCQLMMRRFNIIITLCRNLGRLVFLKVKKDR